MKKYFGSLGSVQHPKRRARVDGPSRNEASTASNVVLAVLIAGDAIRASVGGNLGLVTVVGQWSSDFGTAFAN